MNLIPKNILFSIGFGLLLPLSATAVPVSAVFSSDNVTAIEPTMAGVDHGSGGAAVKPILPSGACGEIRFALSVRA